MTPSPQLRNVHITESTDLEPLRAWILERLRHRAYGKVDLEQELRSQPWLVTHLNKVLKLLVKTGEIDRLDGTVSLTTSPRLPGL